MLINSKNSRNRSNWFRAEWYILLPISQSQYDQKEDGLPLKNICQCWPFLARRMGPARQRLPGDDAQRSCGKVFTIWTTSMIISIKSTFLRNGRGHLTTFLEDLGTDVSTTSAICLPPCGVGYIQMSIQFFVEEPHTCQECIGEGSLEVQQLANSSCFESRQEAGTLENKYDSCQEGHAKSERCRATQFGARPTQPRKPGARFIRDWPSWVCQHHVIPKRPREAAGNDCGTFG